MLCDICLSGRVKTLTTVILLITRRKVYLVDGNRPFASSDHVVQNPPCWKASSLLFPHWDIKTKNQWSLICLCLMSREWSGFQTTVEKPKPKELLRPITTGAGSAMNQSQFLAIPCNSLEARERSRAHCAIGFGFDSHRLKSWRESFKPITKRTNRNIT